MGEGILIDTDVLIDYVKGFIELPSERLFVSEIVLYEFIRGTKDVDEAKKAIEDAFMVIFHNNEIISLSSKIWIELRREGSLLDDRDLLIASTAIVHGLKLLTRNVRHYKRLEKFGLKLASI
ncbi:MAG: type II toxin-antitoxin system VapC family toxin [Archaeoglobus sp.]|nr:type II toxin-antitoxin system VapC family toxin [Archaeoglobus sp.]